MAIIKNSNHIQERMTAETFGFRKIINLSVLVGILKFSFSTLNVLGIELKRKSHLDVETVVNGQ